MSTYSSQTGRLPSQYLLKQRYIIVDQAGRGGMGAVYRAIDTLQGRRQVAVKELSQAHLNEAELKDVTARFQQEAAMLAALSHPNLPHILDAFSEEGRSYLVMDFIEGQTLQQILRDTKQPLPVQQVLHYARQLCDVLSYLHQRNPPIIFRDVKPTNIMITPNGHVFLIDFGIARFFKEGQAQDTLFLGSPGYAPPEQHGLSQTNQQSDLYGLGATLHYCLTGVDPYYAKTRFTFPPVHTKNPSVPVELDQLVQRMLAYQAPQRPASATEVQQILRRISQQAADNTSGLRPDIAAASAPTQYNPPLPTTTSPALPLQQPAHIAPTVAVKPSAAAPLATTSPDNNRGTTPVTPLSGQSATTSTRPSWLLSFSGVLIAVVAIIIGSAIPIAVSVLTINGWDYLIEACLLLLCTIIALVGSVNIRGTAPKGILLVTSFFAIIAGLAALSLGSLDVQNALAFLTLSNFIQILTFSMVAIAIVSFLWLLRPFSLNQRINLIIVFAIVAICTIAQIAQTNYGLEKHIFLFVALICLILGTVAAMQMERSKQI